MIPNLGGVVDETSGGLPEDVFQRRILELRTLDQVVQISDVRLMVFTVMVFERLSRDMGKRR